MRFRTKILNHFCRGCGTLLSADERQTGLCSSCWFEKEKKQSLDDKDWREELLRELDGYAFFQEQKTSHVHRPKICRATRPNEAKHVSDSQDEGLI